MKKLYTNPYDGTTVTERKGYYGDTEVVLTVGNYDAVATPKSVELTLDDVDRLLAVVDHAVDPVFDLAEFFEGEDLARWQALRLAHAFVNAANTLAALVYA